MGCTGVLHQQYDVGLRENGRYAGNCCLNRETWNKVWDRMGHPILNQSYTHDYICNCIYIERETPFLRKYIYIYIYIYMA